MTAAKSISIGDDTSDVSSQLFDENMLLNADGIAVFIPDILTG